MKTFQKKLITVLLLCLMSTFLVSVSVSASTASTNKKADKLYMSKIRSLAKSRSGICSYKIIDLTGDGIHECIAECKPTYGGSGYEYYFYKYSKGKVVKYFSMGHYGVDKIFYWRKTKTLMIHRSGHGGEGDFYYILKSGQPKDSFGYQKERLCRVRTWGGASSGKWRYRNTNRSLNANQFYGVRKKLAVGKKLSLGNPFYWKYVKVR